MPETVLMRLHPSRLAFVKSYIVAVLLVLLWFVLFYNPLGLNLTQLVPYRAYTFVALLLGILLAVSAEIRLIIDTYVITDFRITERVGLLSIRESSVHWDRIADVRLTQSFIERILGIGTIKIESTGGNEAPEVTLKSIRRVVKIKELIDQKMLEWKGGGPRQPSEEGGGPGGTLNPSS